MICMGGSILHVGVINMRKFVKHPIKATTVPILHQKVFTPHDVGMLLRQIIQLRGYSISVCESPDGVEFSVGEDIYTAMLGK